MTSSFSLSPKIRSMATVLRPADAEPPILPEQIRTALHGWMTEIRCEDELREVGVTPRRTAMLSGPPGCGKTTLAHHLAARLGLPLVCISMDRLRSKYVGETGSNIANLFEEIGNHSENCVLFLDEFDAIATKRTDDNQASGREANSIVSALLTRVENFSGTMIAATNRPDAIDPAMWRRFGLQMEIPIPGDLERYAILVRYLDPFTLPEDTVDMLSEATAGASPALLRQVMEGVKRDLILGPRLNYQMDSVSVFRRVMASVKPHPDYEVPPLWAEASVRGWVKDIPWPPTRMEAKKE